MEKKDEKITLVKGKEKREFSKAAAEIAMDHFGWTYLPTPPPEILKGTGPIPMKRKIEPPIIPATEDEQKPGVAAKMIIDAKDIVPAEVRKPEEVAPKPKRPTKKK